MPHKGTPPLPTRPQTAPTFIMNYINSRMPGPEDFILLYVIIKKQKEAKAVEQQKEGKKERLEGREM
jgi:hypothetical protein